MVKNSVEFGIGTLWEELAWLRPAIVGWHVAIEETCAILKDDKRNEPPYASTEQAGVSFLAAGAWKAGMVAAAELSVVKSGPDGQLRNGRTDLLISDREGRHMADFEAKREYVQPDADWSAREARLDSAVSEARRNRLRANVGVCFYPLFVSEFRATEESGGIDSIIEEEIRASSSMHAELLAWSFPTIMREHKIITGNRDFWPGLFVAMRLADQDTNSTSGVSLG